MASVSSDHGPSWHDVNATLSEMKKAHQRPFEVTIGQTLPVQGFPLLYVRVVCWLGVKDGFRQHERGKGHQFPTRECKTVPGLIYRLLIELDAELTYGAEQAEQQAHF